MAVLLMEMGTPRKTRLCVSESWEEAWKVSVDCVVETPLRIFFKKLLSVRAQGKWWFWTLNVFSHSSVSVYVYALTHTCSHARGDQKAQWVSSLMVLHLSFLRQTL